MAAGVTLPTPPRNAKFDCNRWEKVSAKLRLGLN